MSDISEANLNWEDSSGLDFGLESCPGFLEATNQNVLPDISFSARCPAASPNMPPLSCISDAFYEAGIIQTFAEAVFRIKQGAAFTDKPPNTVHRHTHTHTSPQSALCFNLVLYPWTRLEAGGSVWPIWISAAVLKPLKAEQSGSHFYHTSIRARIYTSDYKVPKLQVLVFSSICVVFWKSCRKKRTTSRSEKSELFNFFGMLHKELWEDETLCIWKQMILKSPENYYQKNITGWASQRSLWIIGN